ncbi:MAG TPA: hypothetical protein VEQ35_02805 [Beijerinckia sp.]|jgi:hypothetical protein|nr:hypothetical protein [Beijerinckia sp.]
MKEEAEPLRGRIAFGFLGYRDRISEENPEKSKNSKLDRVGGPAQSSFFD